MKAWHEVGSLADVERDGRILARIGGREIGVVRDPQSGECTPCGTAARTAARRSASARSAGARRASPDATHRGQDRAPLPWHGWEFDVDSGHCVDDERMRVAVYPVRVEEGRVLVEA